VHVVIHFAGIEFRIVQNVPNKIPQIDRAHTLQLLMIQQYALASGEGATVLHFMGRQELRLQRYHI